MMHLHDIKLEEVQIGVVKSYYPDKGYGFIQSKDYDFFFHKKQVNYLPNISNIVGFKLVKSVKKKGKYEAIQVKLANEYTQEFEVVLKRRNLHFANRQLILKCVPHLYDNELRFRYSYRPYWLNSIEEYIEKFNLNSVLKDYRVVVVDETTKASTENHTRSIKLQSQGLAIENIQDAYIRKFLSLESVKLSYTDWIRFLYGGSIEEEIKSNWNNFEEEAHQIECDNSLELIRSYSRNDHRDSLTNQLKTEMKRIKDSFDEEIEHSTKQFFEPRGQWLKERLVQEYLEEKRMLDEMKANFKERQGNRDSK